MPSSQGTGHFTAHRMPVLLLVPVLAIAACGGGGTEAGDRTSVPAPPVTSATVSAPVAAPTTPPVTPPVPGAGTGAAPAPRGSAVPSSLGAFVACMRRHGVNVPAPGQPATPPPPQDPARTQNALKACIRYVTQAPSGG